MSAVRRAILEMERNLALFDIEHPSPRTSEDWRAFEALLITYAEDLTAAADEDGTGLPAAPFEGLLDEIMVTQDKIMETADVISPQPRAAS